METSSDQNQISRPKVHGTRGRRRRWHDRFHWPLFSRSTPHAVGRELGSFSCSIPPSFVVSHNVPMINTRANWLRFGVFLSLPPLSLQFHWPLFFRHWQLFSDLTPHAPRRTLHASPAGSGPAQTLPRWQLPDTDSRIGKDRTGPISRSGPSIFNGSKHG